MENVQIQSYMHFLKGVLQHIVAILVVAILSSLAATVVLSNYLVNKSDVIYLILSVTIASAISFVLFSFAYKFFCKEKINRGFQILSCVLIFLITLSTSMITVLYSKKSNADLVKDVNPNSVTALKASVTVDMSGPEWKDLTDVERQSSDKLSKATMNIEYIMKKHDSIPVFSHRIGTTAAISPEWESDPAHPILSEETVIDASKKCSDKIRIAKMVKTDIIKEKIDQPFNYWFKISYFNGHNKHKNEWHAFFVEIPIESLDYKIRFPKGMPFPKSIRLFKASSCHDSSVEQKQFSKEKSPKDYFEENKTEKEIIWHIENPSVKHIYKIEWDWE